VKEKAVPNAERGFPIKEVIGAVERATDLLSLDILGARRTGDHASLISDASKARHELHRRPRFVGADEIARMAWGWHQRALLRGAL
jgi:UDP-glucose 4-epimerase